MESQRNKEKERNETSKEKSHSFNQISDYIRNKINSRFCYHIRAILRITRDWKSDKVISTTGNKIEVNFDHGIFLGGRHGTL